MEGGRGAKRENKHNGEEKETQKIGYIQEECLSLVFLLSVFRTQSPIPFHRYPWRSCRTLGMYQNLMCPRPNAPENDQNLVEIKETTGSKFYFY